MNGAESLVRTLLASGVDTCFANPGTSEMHFVAALDRVPGMNCVLGLFEGVVTGAADGYARMTGKPAATLLHCGPGLANGLANLHNASARTCRSSTSSATRRPITSRSTRRWRRTPRAGRGRSPRGSAPACSRSRSAGMRAEAVQAARNTQGIATLILPSDASWSDGGVVAEPVAGNAPWRVCPTTRSRPSPRSWLRGRRCSSCSADGALMAPALADAHRIAAATGALLPGRDFQHAHRARTRAASHRTRAVRGRCWPSNSCAASSMSCWSARSIRSASSRIPASRAAWRRRGDGRPRPCRARRGRRGCAGASCRCDRRTADTCAGGATARRCPPVVRSRRRLSVRSLTALMPEDAVVVDESITFGFRFLPGYRQCRTA